MLNASWTANTDLPTELLPIAITGAHAGFDGNHRTATFEAASNAQLFALGVGQADLANIRAGLERSPHHAARAIDDAFTRLDPNSDTARAAQAELAADQDAQGRPTITVQPDGSFRVDDADGNEVGVATDAEGARKLADATVADSENNQTSSKNNGPPFYPPVSGIPKIKGRIPINSKYAGKCTRQEFDLQSPDSQYSHRSP